MSVVMGEMMGLLCAGGSTVVFLLVVNQEVIDRV